MKNNDIKLIATDMDGTFLNDQHQYDQDLLRKVLASCKKKASILLLRVAVPSFLSNPSLKDLKTRWFSLLKMVAW